MKESFDLIVIGAGSGGSTFAALIAKKGRSVLVVDKNPRAGGRMLTVHKEGFPMSYFLSTASRHETRCSKKSAVSWTWKRNFSLFFLKKSEYCIVRTYILASFGEGAFEMPSDRTSAAEMLKLFQIAQKNGGGRYYKGGLGTVFEAYTRRVEELGGKVLMNTRVDHINYKKGAACGITTESGQIFDAPIVVSNAGFRQTVLKLAGKKHFSEEYLSWCRNLEHNLACAGFRYFLDAPVLEYPMYIYYPEGCVAPYKEFEDMAAGIIKPEHSYIYLGTTSLYPDTAPSGKQLVYACMSCLAREVNPTAWRFLRVRVALLSRDKSHPSRVYISSAATRAVRASERIRHSIRLLTSLLYLNDKSLSLQNFDSTVLQEDQIDM